MSSLMYGETCMKRKRQFCVGLIVLFFCWSSLKRLVREMAVFKLLCAKERLASESVLSMVGSEKQVNNCALCEV